MKVYGIVCPLCKTFVFSRAHHDCRSCPCGDAFIDGGQENGCCVRIGAIKTPLNKIKTSFKYIKQTKRQLYNDWNTGKDKYGWIKVKKSVEKG